MTNHRIKVGTPYDYLTERFRIATLLGAGARVLNNPRHWGAKVIQVEIARGDLIVQITDAQMPDPGTGALVRCLSEWDPDRRRAFNDLHWCIELFPPGGPILVRHQAPDSEYQSLTPALTEVLRYALHSAEVAL